MKSRHVLCRCAAAAVLLAVGCARHAERPEVLAAGMPLHLEECLDAATVVGSHAPEDAARPVTWTFGPGEPEWSPVPFPGRGTLQMEVVDGVMRLQLDERNRRAGGTLSGAVRIDLPDWRRDDWAEVRVTARTEGVRVVRLLYNLAEETGGTPYEYAGEGVSTLRDGHVHSYRLRAGGSDPEGREWRDPWQELILRVSAREPASIDILSVEAIPKMALYADSRVGVRYELREGSQRRTLFMHAPGSVEYSVEVPEEGRLDFGLGVLSRPVSFRVTATPSGGSPRVLFEEEVAARERWVPGSADLSDFAGETVTLALEARSGPAGDVALWAAPTLSGSRPEGRPNVIFYVVDGAGADLMSVYGYNRRTTPYLEKLAAEGAVFERAYSNSAWTKPSTASFMTSLHQSVLGGFLSLHDPVPDQAKTMAEHFHDAGYQTAVFTSNPWAGSLSNLQRGTDVFRDHATESASDSSVELQEQFWEWRARFPGEPYWVHFQTTDVHEPHRPEPPFAGMFVAPELRALFYEWWSQVSLYEIGSTEARLAAGDPAQSLSEVYRQRLAAIGADPTRFFDTQRGLYDETMAHQDRMIGRLVERLKATGEWENTLLVIASDHGHPAGSFSRFGRELFDPPPPTSEGALLDSYRSRIPMIFVWPGHIAPGQRLAETVSMIDMLPTLLDLAGLPPPSLMQGQSLAPLLRGEPGWSPRPVILEQLQPVPERGEFAGHIEIIDGRWGASLEIWPDSIGGDEVRPVGQQRSARPHLEGQPRLLLYDLWNDPYVRQNVNDRHPDLVEKYTQILEEQRAIHAALARQFEVGRELSLAPEQLEGLRALGYVE